MFKKFFLYFFIILCLPLIPHGMARMNPTISKFHWEIRNNQTILTFHLKHLFSLCVKKNSKSNEIIIQGSEDSYWKINNLKFTKNPCVKEAKLSSLTSSPRQLILTIKPGTTLADQHIQHRNQEGCVYQIKLINIPPPQISQDISPPPIEEHYELPEPIEILPEKPIVPEPEPEPEPVPVIEEVKLPEILTDIQIIPQIDGTWWLKLSTVDGYFNYRTYPQDNKISLYIHKTNWEYVHLNSLKSELISEYIVNTNGLSDDVLDITVNGLVTLIDQFYSPNINGTYDFVLVLATRPATPLETYRIVDKEKMLKKYLKILNKTNQKRLSQPVPSVTENSSSDETSQVNEIPLSSVPQAKIETIDNLSSPDSSINNQTTEIDVDASILVQEKENSFSASASDQPSAMTLQGP